ncbi:MAG: hypothetical protein Kow00120_11240 [Anaerolineae bacterium]
MTRAFDEAKARLESQGILTDDQIEALEAEHGRLTDEERVWLNAEIYERLNSGRANVTMEQYLEATKILESADPGSPEYARAEAIANAFEASA